MNIGDTVTATITVGDDAGVDYTLVSGTIDGFPLGALTPVIPTTYTATFTVTAGGNDIAAGANVPVANLVLSDTASAANQSLAFNGSVSPAGAADSIDANVPTLSSVTIASNNANPVWAKTGEVVTVSFTANESVGTPTVTIAGQDAVEAGGSTVWTATYTMQAGDAEGVVPFTIDFADLATNAGVQVTAATNASSVTYDKTNPSIAFTQDVEAGPVASDTVNLTVTETNGNAATYFYGFSGETVCDATDTYSEAFLSATPFTLNTETNNTKYVCAKAVDNAGNIGYSAASANDLNIDVTAPVISSISMPTGTYKIGDSFVVTITADAAGYTAGTITVNGVAVTGFTDAGLGVYTATYTVVEGHTDVLAAGVPTASVTLIDSVLNENTAYTTVAESGGDVVIDAHRPTVSSVVLADPALKKGETSLVTITFSEAVTNFTNADVTTIDNGALTAVSSGDGGITWTATFTPTDNFEDNSNTIVVNAATVNDFAGNAGMGTGTSANYAIDTLRPTLGVVVTDTALKAGETSLVTFTFSEPVTNFDNTDVTVIENGGLSAVSSGDGGTTWTATLTPTPDVTDATNIITVDMTTLTDVAGNAGTGTTDSNNYAIDTLRPTVGIVLDDSALKIGETATVTFTFSEAPTGFTGADVTVGSGSIGAI
ncbi:MAG: Ig-like domain-containing protein, partial [Patescibacteria group bacterium]